MSAPTQKVCEVCGNDEVNIVKDGDVTRWLCDEHLETGDRCEAVYNPGTWPYARRCEKQAVAVTEAGSHYCDDHKEWDE